MSIYPSESHFKQWEIVSNGESARLRFMNRDMDDSLLTLPYPQMIASAQAICSALTQMTATRIAHGKSPNPNGAVALVQPPMPVDRGFQMHIATDRSHVLLELQSSNGLVFQYSMAVTQAEGIARKILGDLDLYRPQ